jgi:hypothetical protein
LFHPAIFFDVDSGIGVGKEFADGSEASAAVGEVYDVVRVEVVLEGPACPDASDGRSGVDEDPVHIDEQGGAGDLRHQTILLKQGSARKGLQ